MTEEARLILAIDDEPDSHTLLKSVFPPGEFSVLSAFSGQEAIDLLQGTLPDLILLDITMPGMDGFEVCRKIKNSDKTSDIPVIFLTSRTDGKSLQEAFDCGAVDYVKKPFNISELTARVMTHISLRQSRKKVESANAIRDKFFLILSHDLKNPFNSILMNTSLLKNRFSSLDDQMKQQLVDGIQSSVEQTYSLFENLLEWSKKQTGILDINQEEIDLWDTAEMAVSLSTNQADSKKLTLVNEIPSGTTAFADSYMIRLVFRNLLSNAIKFSYEGGVVKILCSDQGESWEIRVSDQGKGIPAHEIDYLFRLDIHHTTYGTKMERGAGLGLILCHEFIELNQGEIRVDSVPDQQTDLIFTLPKPR